MLPRIENVKSNMIKVFSDSKTIMYSYDTPVVVFLLSTMQYYKTTEFFSVTTSKHINQFLDGIDKSRIVSVSQSELENL